MIDVGAGSTDLRRERGEPARHEVPVDAPCTPGLSRDVAYRVQLDAAEQAQLDLPGRVSAQPLGQLSHHRRRAGDSAEQGQSGQFRGESVELGGGHLPSMQAG